MEHKTIAMATIHVVRSVLIRWRAWWYNKVPLSVTLMLLLLDGHRFSVDSALAFVLLVLSVCAVGNYGYATNELYDIDEDARVGRKNAATDLGPRRVQIIIITSAGLAVMLSWMAAGAHGAGLTLLCLALPYIYSRPPWRIKERKWLGVAADALAAHVYPAALAMLVVVNWDLRSVPVLLAASVLAWSAAVGMRGILSHQLHTSERDRQGGLTTVVHDYGALRIERLIVFVLLPIEVATFVGAILLCDGGAVLWVLGGVYLGNEAFKTLTGDSKVKALRPEGQPYIPFVEESFYKVWGPIVIALDAARIDFNFLLVIPLYWLLFETHLRQESIRLRAVRRALSRISSA